MAKRDVLSLFALTLGCLLSLGDAAALGVPLAAVSAYLLAEPRTQLSRRRVSAAMSALVH